MSYLNIRITQLYNERFGLLILLILWLLAQLIAYLTFGVRTPIDTELYISDAQLLTHGIWPQERSFWYLSYTLLLAGIHFLGGKPTAIIFIQLLASGFATLAIYKLTQRISNNNINAFIASLLYICWFKLHQWNMIVYTDALFTSATVITITIIHFSKNTKQYLIALVALLITVFLRPTGIGFFIAILVYYMVKLVNQNKKTSSSIIAHLTASIVIGVFSLNFVLNDFVPSFIGSYAKAEIIYPNITLGIKEANNLYIPNKQLSPLIQMASFMVYNPVYFAKISFIKTALFIAHVKPYYSIFHNAFIFLFLYPSYYFMLKSVKLIKDASLKMYMILFISFQIITVGLTSENWDGRFLLPILPLVFIIASIGITRILERKFLKVTSNN